MKDYWKRFDAVNEEERLERSRAGDWVITEVEPLFDAADVARFGKDLVVQHSSVTNAAGISWLRRHFPDHRIHLATFKEDFPFHIDTTVVPIRPVLVLLNRKRTNFTPELLEVFPKNDWEVVECAEPAHEKKHALAYCSIWLSLNVLMLDPKTVCVEAEERTLCTSCANCRNTRHARLRHRAIRNRKQPKKRSWKRLQSPGHQDSFIGFQQAVRRERLW